MKKTTNYFLKGFDEGMSKKESIEDFCKRVHNSENDAKRMMEDAKRFYEFQDKYCSKCEYKEFYFELKERFEGNDW